MPRSASVTALQAFRTAGGRVPSRGAQLTAACVLVLSAVASAAPSLQERGTTALITQLRAADPAARAQAACALRDLGDAAADAIDPLVALLADAAPLDAAVCDSRRDWSGDGATPTSPGEQAAAALVAIGSRSLPRLLSALRSPAWAARRNASWALGALRAHSATQPLVDALRDREAPVREQAAWALGAIRDRAAVPPLLAVLADADPRVRRRAAWALGALGDDRAATQLVTTLQDQDPGVREQAAWALGVVRQRAAVQPLIRVLGDASARVRRQAAWALGVLGDPQALDPLLTALKDADPTVRRQAAWAIGVVGK